MSEVRMKALRLTAIGGEYFPFSYLFLLRDELLEIISKNCQEELLDACS